MESSEAYLGEAEGLLRRVDPPLWIVTATYAGDRGGLVATAACAASIAREAPRVVLVIGREHHTWGLIEGSQAFALHLLGTDIDSAGLATRFGLESSKMADKFAGLETVQRATGSPILPSTAGWLDCRVEASLDIGDRTVYLGQVVAARNGSPGPLLTLAPWLKLLPPEMVDRLRRQFAEDAALDAQAIEAWRKRQRRSRSRKKSR